MECVLLVTEVSELYTSSSLDEQDMPTKRQMIGCTLATIPTPYVTSGKENRCSVMLVRAIRGLHPK